MAEIPIERKERRSWLPLLLLGLLALGILAYCATRRDPAGPVAAADSATTDSTATTTVAAGDVGAVGATAGVAGAADAGGAIDRFTQFVQARDTSVETEGRHQYTAEGTQRLAAALEALAGDRADVRVYADSMRASIDRLQRSSDTDRHADDAKAAFSAAVSAMEAIDRSANRTRDLAPVRATYRDLDGSRALLPQLGTVHRFFDAARDALAAMRS